MVRGGGRWQSVRWGDTRELFFPRAGLAPPPSPDLISVPDLGGSGAARVWVLSWVVNVLEEPIPLFPMDRSYLELITGVGASAVTWYQPLAPSPRGRPTLQSVQFAAQHVRARAILDTSLPLPLLGDVRWQITAAVAPYTQPTTTEI